MKKFCSYLVLAISMQSITSLSLPRTSGGREITSLNKTEVDKLVNQQTEAIKKIVSDRQQIQLAYPQVDEPLESKEIQKNASEVNLEDLRIKCQHLEKLFRANNSKFEPDGDDKPIEAAATTFYRKKFASQAYPSQSYPVYFQGRKGSTKTTTPKVKGFYITTDSSDSASTTPKPLNKDQSNVKYIKLEPVILQKTFLTNGKVVYYWHKSLPSAIQYSNPYIQTEKVPVYSTTTPSTTTTSSIYSFKNFFPFYGNSDSYQTPADTTTTTSTTPKTYADFEDLSTQLRFVVPVPYMNPDNVSREPWDFDQFAYYPKGMQPSRVNIQVPYVPTFHVIKALAVPNKYAADTGINTNVGDQDKSYSNYGTSN